MAASINDYLYQLKEFWASRPPLALWSKAGPYAKMIVMGSSDSTWVGDGLGLVPLMSKLNGNGGPNFARVYSLTSPSSGVQFQVTAREHWAIMDIEGRLLEFGTAAGTVAGQDTRKIESMNTATSFMHQLSYLLHSDGTGRIAKGNGTYSVAGSTIELLNKQCMERFEIGDYLVFVDPAAAVPASGMPAYRPIATTALQVLGKSGRTLTVDQNVSTAVPTATNADYIGKYTFYDSSHGLVDGWGRWVPITTTEALTTWATVDRSLDDRLGGRRVQVDVNDTPYQIVGKIGVELMNATGGLDETNDYAIFVPSTEISALTQEMAANGITFTSSTTLTDKTTLQMGVQVVKAAWPGLGSVTITADKFLCDPNVPETEDRTYFCTDLSKKSTAYITGPTGLSWKQYEDNGGMLKAKPGTNDYYAQYGCSGNLFINDPPMHVVASTRAGL